MKRDKQVKSRLLRLPLPPFTLPRLLPRLHHGDDEYDDGDDEGDDDCHALA